MSAISVQKCLNKTMLQTFKNINNIHYLREKFPSEGCHLSYPIRLDVYGSCELARHLSVI